MATVVSLRDKHQEPKAKTLVRVLETLDGRMVVTFSDGMDRSRAVGNLMMAALHLASENPNIMEGGA